MREITPITGASAGIGARAFARLACDLASCARRVALGDELSSARPTLRIAIGAIDVTNYDEVFSRFHDFRERLGRIDRIVVDTGIAWLDRSGWVTFAPAGGRRRPRRRPAAV